MNKKAKSEMNPAVSAANGTAAAPAPARKQRAAKAKPAAAAAAKVVRTRRKTAEPQASTLDLAALQQEIARQAYLYWEERGRQGGSDLEDWLRAEAEIRQRFAAAP